MTRKLSANRMQTSRAHAVLLILSGCVGTFIVGAASAAAAGGEAPAVVVRYAPDSVATPRAAKLLYHRLELAAEKVCPIPFTASRLPSDAVLQCRRQAVARAVQQIDNPRLAAVHNTMAKRG